MRYKPLYILIFLSLIHNKINCLHFKKDHYQDIIINGKLLSQGIRQCLPTYNLIEGVIKNYKRPITVIDLGAAHGYFSIKIASKFDATCVMVEDGKHYPKHAAELLTICRNNAQASNNLIFLNQTLTQKKINQLSECEHFDVVLALNFIHHSGYVKNGKYTHDWKGIADSILKLGETIIIETPPPNETACSKNETKKRMDIEKYLYSHGAILLGIVPRHTSKYNSAKVFMIQKKKNEFARRHILWPPPYEPNNSIHKKHLVQSSYNEKFFIKIDGKKQEVLPFKKGINLLTFIYFGGIYPEHNTIKKELTKLSKIPHADWSPANMILQGKTIQMIDFENQINNNNLPFIKRLIKTQYKKTLLMLKTKGGKNLHKFYWTKFMPKEYWKQI